MIEKEKNKLMTPLQKKLEVLKTLLRVIYPTNYLKKLEPLLKLK
jgi:hypothetical protein